MKITNVKSGKLDRFLKGKFKKEIIISIQSQCFF